MKPRAKLTPPVWTLRSRAEQLLASSRREVAEMPVDDVQKLVQELQVHQIELEMQNEELRRTQLKLEAARERLRLPYDAAPVGFLTLDAKGVILEANLAAGHLLNFDRVKLTGRKLTQFIASESQDDYYLLRQQLLSTGEKQTCELRLLRRGGPPCIARMEAVLDAIGPETAARCLAMVSDITVQKQAEEALKQARDELEVRVRERTRELTWVNAALRDEKAFSDSLIELAPAAIAVIDAQGNLIRTNAHAELLTGFAFAETQGRDMIGQFVPKEHQSRVRRLLREALQNRAEQGAVAPVRTRDGSIRYIEWFSKPLANAAGEPSAVLAIGHDITKRRLAEDSLRRNEQHLANFFQLAPIGLTWLSASGTILRVNQAQLDMLGCAEKDFLGHSYLEFSVEPASGRHLLERLAARETVRNLRMARRCRDGSIRHVLVDAISLWNENQFQYSAVFTRDITNRINLELEVLHISEREHRRIAQDLHDGLGQLLVGAAYLTGTVQQDLAAKSRPQARKLRRVQDVISEAISQTRNLARGLHPVEPDPNGLVAALDALAARTKKLFQVRCHFRCRQPVLIRDNAVATHLFRIAQEAVTNAIKHGKPGRIEISLAETPGHINLAINDDGSGLPARRRKSAGLGLRIMRYRAGLIGGSLAIQKGPAGGTTVVCTVHVPGQGPLRARRKAAGKNIKKH
jgi:PAS domain S-box-containing protein